MSNQEGVNYLLLTINALFVGLTFVTLTGDGKFFVLFVGWLMFNVVLLAVSLLIFITSYVSYFQKHLKKNVLYVSWANLVLNSAFIAGIFVLNSMHLWE
ncbi:MAG: hypothetical protein KDC73_00410 [Ignavibacteriae bacterium]|nr:hypothetical protein [Ignavibacteriota bacterium]MCB9242980.1 hypothetical protein [Ignavibacteriales bacterium]